jgi:hypothetical protein
MKSGKIFLIFLIAMLLSINFTYLSAHVEEEQLHYSQVYTFDIGKGYVLAIILENYLPPILPANNSVNATFAVYNHTYSPDSEPVMHVTYNVTVLDSNNQILNILGTNQQIHSMNGPFSLVVSFPGKGIYNLNIEVVSIGMASMGELIKGFSKVSLPLYIGIEPPNTKIFIAEVGHASRILLEIYPYNSQNPSLNTTILIALFNGTGEETHLVHHVTYSITIKDSSGTIISSVTNVHYDTGVYKALFTFPKYGNYTVEIQVVSVGHPDIGVITGFSKATFLVDLSYKPGSNNPQQGIDYFLLSLIIIVVIAIVAVFLVIWRRSFKKA